MGSSLTGQIRSDDQGLFSSHWEIWPNGRAVESTQSGQNNWSKFHPIEPPPAYPQILLSSGNGTLALPMTDKSLLMTYLCKCSWLCWSCSDTDSVLSQMHHRRSAFQSFDWASPITDPHFCEEQYLHKWLIHQILAKALSIFIIPLLKYDYNLYGSIHFTRSHDR